MFRGVMDVDGLVDAVVCVGLYCVYVSVSVGVSVCRMRWDMVDVWMDRYHRVIAEVMCLLN